METLINVLFAILIFFTLVIPIIPIGIMNAWSMLVGWYKEKYNFKHPEE